jgi:hypothetical protein
LVSRGFKALNVAAGAELDLSMAQEGTRVDRSAFAVLLRNAILGAWDEIIAKHGADRPYAFALVGGQCADYLGYAVATEAGLQRVAAKYHRRGYRYEAWEWEQFDNREKLATWLRWANPDDGWLYGDFPDRLDVQAALAQLVEKRSLGPGAEDFEEFCTEVLANLLRGPTEKAWGDGVVVGFTYGEDPRDFLRTATRANPYRLVKKVWAEYWQGEELSRRIPAPK